MYKVSCEGRKPMVWGYRDAQSYWRRKFSKNLGEKVLEVLWILRAQLRPNTWLEVRNHVASMRHFKCSHSPFPQLQKAPTHQLLPKTRWGGMRRPRTSRNVVTTFSTLRTEGTNGWGTFGKVRSLAWISGAPQGKKALQTRTRALARAGRCQGTSGASQGGHSRAGRGCKGWVSFTGEAKSLIQQLLESAEGKGGWTSMGSQTGSRSMGGGHVTVEENHQKERGRPTITSSSPTSSPHTAVWGLFKEFKIKMAIQV